MFSVPALLTTLPQRTLLVLVRGYRLILSPWLQTGCRYEPTCSSFALQALTQHGALAGSTLAAYRVLRCHPWCDGGADPVPLHAPRLFRHLFPNTYLEDFTALNRAAEASSTSTPFDRQPSP